jgi:GNAT superfamily N-acetyltransferase
VAGPERMTTILRQARLGDIEAMHHVRLAVRENRLVSSVITAAQYAEFIEEKGRGWVIQAEGEIVAFAVGNATDGNIWALFVHPDHERRGYGRQLHDTMLNWLRAQGLRRFWLTTGAGTRAQRFYEAAGWASVGLTPLGEVRCEFLL